MFWNFEKVSNTFYLLFHFISLFNAHISKAKRDISEIPSV